MSQEAQGMPQKFADPIRDLMPPLAGVTVSAGQEVAVINNADSADQGKTEDTGKAERENNELTALKTATYLSVPMKAVPVYNFLCNKFFQLFISVAMIAMMLIIVVWASGAKGIISLPLHEQLHALLWWIPALASSAAIGVPFIHHGVTSIWKGLDLDQDG